MLSKRFGFIVIIVFIAVLPMLSGLDGAVFAKPIAKAEKSCGDGCGHDKNEGGPIPRSVPYCPVVLCLSVDLVKPAVTPVVSPAIVSTLITISSFIPDPFIKSIFHPPRTA